MVMCALMAAITCVLAPVSLPVGPVPISLCTFAVMLSGILTGGKAGFLSQLIYVLLGAAGLPVFAGYTGGLSCIAGVTGGYIAAYPVMALTAGGLYTRFGRRERGRRKVLVMFAAMAAGTILLYAFGTAWFCAVSGTAPRAAFTICILPFIPGDLVKMAAVCVIAVPLEKALTQ